ncbi:MAG: hypothetical protein KJO35_05815, partial [Gammaproteobacteria bacterium]|nr:hypothetical protein [Gammaproteobacteria bacterium]
VYDFQVRGFSSEQRTTRIVIPLTVAIPLNAQLRGFANNVWYSFVTSSTDAVRSAASVNNECPAPGDLAYSPGLVAFSDCIELTVTDGGANDADGEANGVIRITNGVAISNVIPGSVNTSGPGVPTAGPQGGGAFGWLSLLFLFLATLLGFRKYYGAGKC